MLPPFVEFESVEEYQKYFEKNYCKATIYTFDGIRIYFSKDKFSHAFFESSDRRGSKDIFSKTRAKRIDWIKHTLQNKSSKILKGWNRKKRKYFPDRRVDIVYENFVVVILLSLDKKGELKGNFITCYQADNSIEKIKKSPTWNKEECLKYLKSKKKI